MERENKESKSLSLDGNHNAQENLRESNDFCAFIDHTEKPKNSIIYLSLFNELYPSAQAALLRYIQGRVCISTVESNDLRMHIHIPQYDKTNRA